MCQNQQQQLLLLLYTTKKSNKNNTSQMGNKNYDSATDNPSNQCVLGCAKATQTTTNGNKKKVCDNKIIYYCGIYYGRHYE